MVATTTSRIIHFASAFATLLSGTSNNLEDCQNATDVTCTAGYAAVSAYWRSLKNTETHDESKLLIPRVDLYSPFSQMHPDGWSVNRVLLHDYFGWDTMVASESLVINKNQELDVLQTTEFPLLMTNVALPPSNSWHPYLEAIHFDAETGLALMFMVPAGGRDGNARFSSQIASAQGSLDHIAKLNAEASIDSEKSPPWIPVIVFSQLSPATFARFIQAMVTYKHPPRLILDIEANALERYGVPALESSTWICSFKGNDRELHRLELNIVQDELASDVFLNDEAPNPEKIANVTLVVEDLTNVTSVMDEQYATDIAHLRELARIAFLNDPIVGHSGFMPLTRDSGNIRRCMGGECPLGNLFTDALQWYTEADFAFVSSGGVRGPGWKAGAVRVTDIWNALPFANFICTGSMLGIHVFEMLNYSTSVAKYQSTFTAKGDQLLQVSSGLRYTYNTQINVSRLVNVEVYDNATQSYEPLNRLKLYSFATDSYLCDIAQPFKQMLTRGLNLRGEKPGVVDEDGLTHQLVVSEFLGSLQDPYNTTIQGRLYNDTDAMEPLDFIQTEDDCRNASGTTWDQETETCIDCPVQGEKVRFAEERVEFTLQVGQDAAQERQSELMNLELYPVRVASKVIPHWMELDNASEIVIESGESTMLAIRILRSPTPNEPGNALGTLSLAVLDGGLYPGCVGRDITLEVLVRTTPNVDKNQLGLFRYIGFTLCGIFVTSSIVFAGWVGIHRKDRMVKAMQPLFLIQICLGVMVIACALATRSIDDQIASEQGTSISCMATPWLIALGATFAFSALFSKLLRINRLFAANFNRIQVRETDVIWPLPALFLVNLTLLLVWTFIDPAYWQRVETNPGQPWNTYGTCSGGGTMSQVMMFLLPAVNFVALLLACYQAYRARNVSDEFSEAKYIAIAVFSWFQVLMVGFPVIFLVDKQDTQTTYFLFVAIISIVCSSMLGLVFVPLFIQRWRHSQELRKSRKMHIVGLPMRESPGVARARASIVGFIPPESVDLANNSSNFHDSDAVLALRSKIETLQAQVSQLEAALEESKDEMNRKGVAGVEEECDEMGNRSQMISNRDSLIEMEKEFGSTAARRSSNGLGSKM